MKHLPALVTLAAILLTAVSCSPTPDPRIVEVRARGMTFEAPADIPAGWVTFRLINESPMVHFGVLERLPEGIHIADQQRAVAPVFQDAMDLIRAGKPDEAMAAFGALPAWFPEVVFLGGPGMTSPGRTCEATVWIEPGTYLLECYVKTGGVFHSIPTADGYGMVHEFTASGPTDGSTEPDASVRVEVSAEEGFKVTGNPQPGRNRIRVVFRDQVAHENFVGHDVHVVRLPAADAIPRLEQWMDWRDPTGLEAPSKFDFIGGLNEMPTGRVGYFTVDLAPGDYAWIAEVPESRKKRLFKAFAVAP